MLKQLPIDRLPIDFRKNGSTRNYKKNKGFFGGQEESLTLREKLINYGVLE